METVANTGSPLGVIIGFCTGLAVLGGLIMIVGTYLLRRYMETERNNENLKAAGVRNSIGEVENTLKLLIMEQKGDFKALSTKVDMALADMRGTNQASIQRYEQVTLGMRKVYERSEARFALFQQKLEEMHVMVERLKVAAGVKK